MVFTARPWYFGPYAPIFWGGAIGGTVVPLALLALLASLEAWSSPLGAAGLVVASVVALGGGFAWEYVWVDAGQCVPNS